MQLFRRVKMIMANIFNTIFPFFEMAKANKKLLLRVEKIENENDLANSIQYMKCYEKLSLEEIKEFFEKTLNIKKSLEEKLKVSLFSVTVGITLLTSMISFLYQDGFYGLNSYIRAGTFFVATLSIVFMIVAAFYAIKTISGKITVYQLFPEDIVEASTEDEKKNSVAICAELNSIMNIIRQNMMSASYHCIVNSLVLVAVLFFSLGVSSFFVNHKNPALEKIEIEVNDIKKSYSSVQSDLSSFKRSTADSQSSIFSSIQNINDTLIDTIKGKKELESKIVLTNKELNELKDELKENSNKANAADAKSHAAD
jgi:hypothetical protein